jgi:hypothetical protein
MVTVSTARPAVAWAKPGTALNNPAWPRTFKKSRRLQEGSGLSILLGGFRRMLSGRLDRLNANAERYEEILEDFFHDAAQLWGGHAPRVHIVAPPPQCF